MLVITVLIVVLTVGTPAYFHALTNSRLQWVLSDLAKIERAKQQFKVAKKLISGSIVNDATDLVPQYLPAWPVGPVPGAGYSANAVDYDSSFNGYTADQLRRECPSDHCPL